MHIAFNPGVIAEDLRLLNKVAPTKAPLPILSHVLLQTVDNELQMYATDLEVGLLTTCRAKVTLPGVIALPAATLLAMVERFVGDDVTVTADKNSALISCGAFKSRIQSLPVSDFAQIPKVAGATATINSAEFNKMLTRTRYAVSDATNQFLLRGALLNLNGEIGAMVGLDGKRLALATMKRTPGPEVRATIPIKTLDMLIAQPDLPETTDITVGERHLFFQMGTRLLISRTLEGEFPKFERIIPQDTTKKAIVSRYALSLALRRVGLIAGDDRSARFNFTPESIEVTSSRADVGDAGERVPVQYEGDPISVCCNWQFVVDFLEAATSSNVSIQLKDEKTPMLLTEGDNNLAVVMLMQG